MNQDTFWALIQEAKIACGQDMDAMTEHLREGLLKMGAGSARQFHNIFQAYMDLEEPFGLWDAASIIKENGCSLENFIDFRAWLIAQGKEVYRNALQDPDTLADVEPYGDCSFESIAYVGNDVYHSLTGQDAYGDLDTAAYLELRDALKRDIVYREGIHTPSGPRSFPKLMPRLCAKYGGTERFDMDPRVWNFPLYGVCLPLEQAKHQREKPEKGGDTR